MYGLVISHLSDLLVSDYAWTFLLWLFFGLPTIMSLAVPLSCNSVGRSSTTKDDVWQDDHGYSPKSTPESANGRLFPYVASFQQ